MNIFNAKCNPLQKPRKTIDEIGFPANPKENHSSSNNTKLQEKIFSPKNGEPPRPIRASLLDKDYFLPEFQPHVEENNFLQFVMYDEKQLHTEMKNFETLITNCNTSIVSEIEHKDLTNLSKFKIKNIQKIYNYILNNQNMVKNEAIIRLNSGKIKLKDFEFEHMNDLCSYFNEDQGKKIRILDFNNLFTNDNVIKDNDNVIKDFEKYIQSKTFFKKFPNLEILSFSLLNEDITELKHLKECSKLKKIILRESNEIENLCFVDSLNELNCLIVDNFSKLTKIDTLPKLPNLKILHLISCRCIIDFTSLGACTALEELNLAGCKIKDWSFLMYIPQLQELDISGCSMDDWTPLKKLGSLKKLNIADNPVTKYKDAIQEYFPNCEIIV